MSNPTNSTETILIGLSGPSCSGKTTLARLLRDALAPHAFVLHEDDFYKADTEIPEVQTHDGQKLQDWDCLESIDLAALKKMLGYVKVNGRVTTEFESKEDQNAVGKVNINAQTVKSYAAKAQELFTSGGRSPIQIAIVDGFLLFSEEMSEIRDLFDVKLLLTTDHDTVKQRRDARKGYVTLEGFWEDPPGYVDLIVWPNFVKDHKFLFRDGDVAGGVDEEVCRRLGILCMPKEAVEDMTGCFGWAMDIILEKLKPSA
jgi:nicotinamide/nicotinate riboside kinase